MNIIVFLVVFPLVVAALLSVIRNNKARISVVSVAAGAIALASILLVIQYLGYGWVGFDVSEKLIDYAACVLGVVVGAVVVGFGVKYKNYLAIGLAVAQIIGDVVFECVFSHSIVVRTGLYLDTFSLIMALIIGIIGSGICVYSLGYMKDFQHHLDESGADKHLTELQLRDRRPVFFALMFVFLSVMYVIVFSNNMAWMFAGWEVTTLCSFLLIAYTRTSEAIRNAFRQIIMNMIGGIAFLCALCFIAAYFETLDFDQFIKCGLINPQLAGCAVGLLALAGLTKAAQMPFQSWLLGAMVAPTPTSALLHSSTMVKAGVFLLVKLTPLFAVCNACAYMVIFVGGLTFMLCSFMAISQSNAKRVLAYSTIANLGLITACAGVATAEAVWTAIVLIIFHAAAKSLLFLCVGTAEHHIQSRDIEDMDLLFNRMPRLARLMMLGIMCMFIAPFGMLIAKWSTLVSLAETKQIILIVMLAFGSAATFMFWAKWLGKLTSIASNVESIELSVNKSEWFALVLMTTLAIVCCVALPVISVFALEPYIIDSFREFGRFISFDAGRTISIDDLWISSILTVFIVGIFCTGLGNSRFKRSTVYLAGVGVDSDRRMYRNSLSQTSEATARNMYLTALFDEKKISRVGEVLCSVIVLVGLLANFVIFPFV